MDARMNAEMSATDGERELLRQTVEDLLAEHCVPARVAAAAAGPGWDADLWQALEETGLSLAGTADYARRLLRLFRSLLIAGAAPRALDLTVTYVKEREQFGRPLAKFPTVQQELARMAGEVALIGAATQAAVAAEGLAVPGGAVRGDRGRDRGRRALALAQRAGLAEQVDDCLGAHVPAQELAAYDFHVGSPVPFGSLRVARVD